MALEKPEAGWVWLHVPRKEPVEVVVAGDVCTWWAHFVRSHPALKGVKGVRCGRADGGSCAWCDADVGRRARYVFPVYAGDVPRLVEFGRVQYPVLSMLYDSGRWVGRRLRLKKEWDAANARIGVEPCGFETLTTERELDCSDYVATLGAAEARSIRPPELTPPSKPSRDANGAGAAPRAPRWSDEPK